MNNNEMLNQLNTIYEEEQKLEENSNITDAIKRLANLKIFSLDTLIGEEGSDAYNEAVESNCAYDGLEDDFDLIKSHIWFRENGKWYDFNPPANCEELDFDSSVYNYDKVCTDIPEIFEYFKDDFNQENDEAEENDSYKYWNRSYVMWKTKDGKDYQNLGNKGLVIKDKKTIKFVSYPKNNDDWLPYKSMTDRVSTNLLEKVRYTDPNLEFQWIGVPKHLINDKGYVINL